MRWRSLDRVRGGATLSSGAPMSAYGYSRAGSAIELTLHVCKGQMQELEI